MPNRKTFTATHNGVDIEAYILTTGTPTPKHVYCQIGGSIENSCKKTFLESELSNIKIK